MKIEEMVRIDYAGQPVLTSKQLSEIFEVPLYRIKHNFRNNKARFVVGIHYFKVEGEELKALKEALNERIINANEVENLSHSKPSTVQSVFNANNSLILYTAQGAARIAKTLHSDEAWKVYNELEQFYFENHSAIEIMSIDSSDKDRLSDLRAEVTGLKETFQRWLQEMEKQPDALTRADKLLAIAEKISAPDLRDKALCKVFNLLIGKNIF